MEMSVKSIVVIFMYILEWNSVMMVMLMLMANVMIVNLPAQRVVKNVIKVYVQECVQKVINLKTVFVFLFAQTEQLEDQRNVMMETQQNLMDVMNANIHVHNFVDTVSKVSVLVAVMATNFKNNYMQSRKLMMVLMLKKIVEMEFQIKEKCVMMVMINNWMDALIANQKKIGF